MLEEQGEVTVVDGDFAWVACRAQVDCARCARGEGCGGGILGRWLGDRLHRVRVLHDGAAGVGDCVVIGIDERALAQAALLIYGVPLVAMLGGAILGQSWYGTDVAAGIGLLGGLAAGFAWLAGFSRKIRRHRRLQPRIIRRVGVVESA